MIIYQAFFKPEIYFEFSSIWDLDDGSGQILFYTNRFSRLCRWLPFLQSPSPTHAQTFPWVTGELEHQAGSRLSFPNSWELCLPSIPQTYPLIHPHLQTLHGSILAYYLCSYFSCVLSLSPDPLNSADAARQSYCLLISFPHSFLCVFFLAAPYK